MNTYVAIASKAGPLGDDHSARIERLARRLLPFRYMEFESRSWRSPSGTMAIHAWCNDPAHPQHAGLIHEDGPDAITLSGHIYDADVVDQAALLRRLRGASDGRSFAADLPGLFAVTLADGSRNTLRTWNSLIPTEPVYWTETDDLIVVGTRAVLVHLIGTGGSMPEYDLTRFGPLLSCGYFASDFTPFRNTKVLPPNSELEISPRGVQITAIDDVAESIGKEAAEPSDGFWDEMTERMLGTMKAIASFGGDIKLNLSGGKDSRLLAGALVSAGVDFSARTAGFATDTDVLGGLKVAEILNLDHRVDSPRNQNPTDVQTNLMRHACSCMFRTEGMINIWGGWLGPSVPFSPVRQVVGQGGEYFRGGWLKHPDNRHDLDLDKCRAIFAKKLNPNAAFLRPEAGAPFQSFLDGLFPNPATQDLEGAMERAFAYTYGWHWAPPGYVGQSGVRHRYYPFCDSKLLRLNYTLPWQDRLREEPHFNMMVRMNPELAYTSFTKFRWGFEADGPVAGRRPETWNQRVPSVPPVNTNVTVVWKKDVGLSPLRDEFRAQIFENPRADAIFEAVDRDKLLRMFNSRTVFSSPASRFLWNVYSASVIVSNEWLERDVPGRPLTVAADHQWYVVRRKILAGLSAGRAAASKYVDDQLVKWSNRVATGATSDAGDDRKAKKESKLISAEYVQDRMETLRTRATEIYLGQLAARVEGVRGALEIPGPTLTRHLGEIKAAERPPGESMSLAELIAEDDGGVAVITPFAPLNVDSAISDLRSGSVQGDLGVLDSVGQFERTVMDSIGVTNFDDVS